ncbi:hypothetical protein BKA69DRAFT_1092685 [Paraphysoderma sedebokerense]|nr:hypothetical protein BKA69DRAFT_1092685 [Paraphysoderma sedebokerense]
MSSAGGYPGAGQTILLINFVRGVHIGVVSICLIITLTLLYRRRTLYNLLATLCNATAIIPSALTVAYDIEVLQNCDARVKATFSFVYLYYLFYEVIQVHKCATIYRGRIRYYEYIFPSLLLLRVVPYILNLANWGSLVLPDGRCQSTLPMTYSIVDRSCQVLFDITMGIMFMIPLLQSSAEFKGSWQRYKEIIFHETFILVASIFVAISFIIFVSIPNAPIIGLLNVAYGVVTPIFITLFVVAIALKQARAQLDTTGNSNQHKSGSTRPALSTVNKMSNSAMEIARA